MFRVTESNSPRSMEAQASDTEVDQEISEIYARNADGNKLKHVAQNCFKSLAPPLSFAATLHQDKAACDLTRSLSVMSLREETQTPGESMFLTMNPCDSMLPSGKGRGKTVARARVKTVAKDRMRVVATVEGVSQGESSTATKRRSGVMVDDVDDNAQNEKGLAQKKLCQPHARVTGTHSFISTPSSHTNISTPSSLIGSRMDSPSDSQGAEPSTSPLGLLLFRA